MKQHPSNEKIVNAQDDRVVNRKEDHGTGKIDAAISANTTGKKKENKNKPAFTQADLKGKKVDGDPELESDQPIDQLH